MVLGDDFHSASKARVGNVIALFLNWAADLLQKQKAAHVVNDIGPSDPHDGIGNTRFRTNSPVCALRSTKT